MPLTHHMLTLDTKTLGALKSLLRFHFIEELVRYFDSAPAEVGLLQNDPRFKALAVVTYVDKNDDLNEPVRFLDAAFGLTNSSEGTVPVRNDIFDELRRIVDAPIATARFTALEPDEVETMLAPLKKVQAELQRMFAEAEAVDPTATPKHHYVDVGTTKRGGPSGTVLN